MSPKYKQTVLQFSEVSLTSSCSNMLLQRHHVGTSVLWPSESSNKKQTMPGVKNTAFILTKKYKQSIFNKQQILTVQHDFLSYSDLPLARHWRAGNCLGRTVFLSTTAIYAPRQNPPNQTIPYLKAGHSSSTNCTLLHCLPQINVAGEEYQKMLFLSVPQNKKCLCHLLATLPFQRDPCYTFIPNSLECQQEMLLNL